MQFNSWAEFWAMGGYGFYVWLSFGIAALVMTGIIYQSWLAHKQLIRHIAAEQKRKGRIRKAAQAAQASSPNSDRSV